MLGGMISASAGRSRGTHADVPAFKPNPYSFGSPLWLNLKRLEKMLGDALRLDLRHDTQLAFPGRQVALPSRALRLGKVVVCPISRETIRGAHPR